MFAKRRSSRNRNNKKLPSYQVENELGLDTSPQYYQVCVNVLEGRKLSWAKTDQWNSYVAVAIGNRRKRTAVKKNMEQPVYREYFVFEMLARMADLHRSSVSFAVMEPRCCGPPRLVGQTDVDLSSVWSESHHQLFHKWIQLSLPKGDREGSRGFLKVDISILHRGAVQYIPPSLNEVNQEYTLSPTNVEKQTANYLISIYRAWGLPNMGKERRRGKAIKLPNTFIRVTYCGLSVKTSVQAHSCNPVYNERLSITEVFPNVNRHLQIEVCSLEGCVTKVLCATELLLDQISHDGENGFLPTFGPGTLHMYGESSKRQPSLGGGPYHRGTILLSFHTMVPFYQHSLRSVGNEPASALDESAAWTCEDFYLFLPILGVWMLDRRVAGKSCGVAVTLGDPYTERHLDDVSENVWREIKGRKANYTGQIKLYEDNPYSYLDFGYTYPVIQQLIRYPDFRVKMFRINMIARIINKLSVTVRKAEKRISVISYNTQEVSAILEQGFDDLMGSIQLFLDVEKSMLHRGEHCETDRWYSTELDDRQYEHQKNEMIKILRELRNRNKSTTSMLLVYTKTSNNSQKKLLKKMVKVKMAEAKILLQKLNNLTFKEYGGMPDIVIWLISGTTKIAYHKIRPSALMYSPIDEQCGIDCCKLRTVALKPVKCSKHLSATCACIAGRLELAGWLGVLRQRTVISSMLPSSYEMLLSGSVGIATYVTAQKMCVECRAYIYRAKLTLDCETLALPDTFVRVNCFKHCADTKLSVNSLSPLWNQTLKIQSVIYSSEDRFRNNPCDILIEICDNHYKTKSEVLGNVNVQCCLDRNGDQTPALEWRDVLKGTTAIGQLLMSVQLVQIEDMDEETVNTMMSLPKSILPVTTTYKIDLYWWGIRGVPPRRKPCAILEIDDLFIKSESIMDSKTNSNFPNGLYTQTFEAALEESHCPPLTIKLYDSGTFGRTVFLGNNILKSPIKFLVDWIPKMQRDATLSNASFEVVERPMISEMNESNLSTSNQSDRSEESARRQLTKWFKPSTHVVQTVEVMRTERNPLIGQPKQKYRSEDDTPAADWWTRFNDALKEDSEGHRENEDTITIYNSELEHQDGFSNFKDWCYTLKMYKGAKTGIPEEDKKLYCGFLKAGIAIYKWPPPTNMIAVSHSGVDLHKNFFSDHPSNEPRKYLVRAYIIRGMNIPSREISSKCNPYVIIKCGKKLLGDRKKHVSKNSDPTFGRAYEFRATLPEDYQVTISLYDYDGCSCTDDLIGSTTIDIEDRVHTKHRATCGLPNQYSTTGINKWRDFLKPSAILSELCLRNHLQPPLFTESDAVLINGLQYDYCSGDNNDMVSKSGRKESTCLKILKKWHSLPFCGHALVPEHVETRTLYNSDYPGCEQGKLQLWLDVFPADETRDLPPAVYIKPLVPEWFELRLVVFNVEDVGAEERDGSDSDIYVKAWLGDVSSAQTTDIHYNCVSGRGVFNWRMVFPFLYHRTERKLILTEKTALCDSKEQFSNACLNIAIMDNDAISMDDHVGFLSLMLDAMPRGARSAKQCNLESVSKGPRLNLFSTRMVRGWWPLVIPDPVGGKLLETGKIDLEINLLTKERALMQPVGVGRESPQPLPIPKRYEVQQYNMLLEPLSSVKDVSKKRGTGSILALVLFTVLALCAVSTLLALPRILLEKVFLSKLY